MGKAQELVELAKNALYDRLDDLSMIEIEAKDAILKELAQEYTPKHFQRLLDLADDLPFSTLLTRPIETEVLSTPTSAADVLEVAAAQWLEEVLAYAYDEYLEKIEQAKREEFDLL